MLHFSRPPEFYSLYEVSLKLSRIYPVLMPLSVRVCVREGGSIKPEAEKERDRYIVRKKCKHCTNPALLICQ